MKIRTIKSLFFNVYHKILHNAGRISIFLHRVLGLGKKEQEFCEQINGKTIALVGNSQCLFDHTYGKDIDKHDIVVRFNKGKIVSPDSQGTRTDVLALACFLAGRDIKKMFGAKWLLWTSPKTKKFFPYGWSTLSKLVFLPNSLWRDINEDYLDGFRPSSGFFVLCYLVEKKPASISLYGFDFGASDTFYNNKNYVSPHNMEKEERWVKFYEMKYRVAVKEC
mgnify:CR=1 FL=1